MKTAAAFPEDDNEAKKPLSKADQMRHETEERLRALDSDEIWLPKDEAAALLKVGIRQLENRVTDGLIRKKVLPKAPSERVARVVFSRADVMALKAGKPNTRDESIRPEPSQSVSNGKSNALAPAAPERGILAIPHALIDLLRERREPGSLIKAPLKPWLTLEEAAEYSGLTRKWLLKEAEAGQGAIAVRDMGGRVRGGRWRFLRADLGRAE